MSIVSTAEHAPATGARIETEDERAEWMRMLDEAGGEAARTTPMCASAGACGRCGWSATCRWPSLPRKAGISIGALSQIERGMSSLRVRVIWPLAAALDIEPSALIADGNDAVNDLYCVRADNRRSIPVNPKASPRRCCRRRPRR